MRIVIVDDEMRERKLINALIMRIEADFPIEIVGHAENGREALQLVKDLNPDVLITDIRMPGLNGLELIHEIRTQKEDLYIIVISGYELFEYAHGAIQYGVEDYLVKPIHQGELEKALEKIASKLERNISQADKIDELKKSKQQDFLFKLVSSEKLLPDGSQVTREMLCEAYLFDFLHPFYYIGILKPDIPIIVDNNEYANRLFDKITLSIKKCMGHYCNQAIYINKDDQIWFYITTDEDISQHLETDIQKLIFDIRKPDGFWSNLHVTAALSAAEEDISKLMEIVEMTARSIDTRIISGTDRVYTNRTFTTTVKIDDYITGMFRRKLSTMLEAERTTDILTLIDDLREQIHTNGDVEGSFLYAVANELIDTLFSSIKVIVPIVNIKDLHTACLRRIRHYHTVQDLFNYIKDTFRKMLLLMHTERKKQTLLPIEKVKRYISQNYSENISQTELSEYVGLSPAYLSTLFKKEEGISFSDYLTRTRIYASCRILSTTNDPIDQIAEAVGYNDARYFSQNFRKIMKLSPSKYRKLYRL